MSMFCDGLRSRIAVCDFFEVADFIDREVTKLVSENLFSDFYLKIRFFHVGVVLKLISEKLGMRS